VHGCVHNQLTGISHQDPEFWGKLKAGWTIGRREIVILRRLSKYQGRSFKMRSQFVPKTG
jgi:hypothetical protein